MEFRNIDITLPHSSVCFKITTNSLILIDFLRRFYEEKKANNCYSKEYHIYFDETSHSLKLDQNAIFCTPIDSLSQVSTFIREHISFEDSWILLHGSAVEINNQTFLFLGETGAGKTTLIAFLSCQSGFHVISEDLTIIDSNTGEIVKRCTPLALRKSSYELLNSRYNCQLIAEKRTYNNKLLCEIQNSVNPSSTVFAKECFLIERKETKLVCTQNPHAHNVFIENSACYTNMVKIVKSALALSQKVRLRTLNYQNLYDVRDFLLSISKS